jgi:hypothetical protein
MKVKLSKYYFKRVNGEVRLYQRCKSYDQYRGTIVGSPGARFYVRQFETEWCLCIFADHGLEAVVWLG